MILSVSRRTDIPAFYSEWFINRLRERTVYVRNPMSYHLISKIDLSPNVVDCIVFWSKNPKPLIKYLEEIEKDYKFYFQFTINAYEKDMEANLPSLDERINTFIELSNKYGSEKVIWRYDPIVLTEKYDINWHIERFNYIAYRLKGKTNACVFSFVDLYEKNKNNLVKQNIKPLDDKTIIDISTKLKSIADLNLITLKTCCEDIDMKAIGIQKSCCVDPYLISQIIKCKIKAVKDKNQRESCGCVESIDIGQYNTCKHGCLYCYANYSKTVVENNCKKHENTSKLLLGDVEENDKIHERDVKTLKDLQTSFFD